MCTQLAFLTMLVLLMPTAICRHQYTDDRWFYRTFQGLSDLPGDIPKQAVTLNLNNNYIRSVTPYALSHLAECTFINLNHNSLTTIQEGAFAGLYSLTELWIGMNNITSLADNAFTGLDSLETLVLSNNALSDLEPAWFEGLPGLRKLYLYENRLTQLRAGMLGDLETLDELTLSRNQINLIEDDAFTGLKNLKTLWLDFNHDLSDIRPNAFRGLTGLEQLWLRNNRITSLSDQLFQDLVNLEELSLDHNLLTDIKPGTFAGLDSLSKVWLYGNRLTTLDHSVFSNLPRRLEMTIADNPLECDRRVCWMKRAEDQGWLRLFSVEGRIWHPQCSNGADWNNLDCSAQVECGDPGGVDNSVRTGGSWPYTVGTEFRYTCNECHTGGGIIMCQNNGTWSPKPTCSAITCPLNETLADGSWAIQSAQCGVKRMCPPGQEAVGDRRVMCGPDGRVIQPPPECMEIREETTTVTDEDTSWPSEDVTTESVPAENQQNNDPDNPTSTTTPSVEPSTPVHIPVKFDQFQKLDKAPAVVAITPSHTAPGNQTVTFANGKNKVTFIVLCVVFVVILVVLPVVMVIVLRKFKKLCFQKSDPDHVRFDNFPKVKFENKVKEPSNDVVIHVLPIDLVNTDSKTEPYLEVKDTKTILDENEK